MQVIKSILPRNRARVGRLVSDCAPTFRPAAVGFSRRYLGLRGLLIASFFLGLVCNPAFALDRLLITQSGGSTSISEAGTTDSFDVVLDSQPSASVTVHLTPDSQIDLGAGAGATVSLSFTTGNYDGPRTITVTPINDYVAEGTHTRLISIVCESGDSGYNGYPAQVEVTITDNDTAGVTIAGGPTNVIEGGATDTYTVRLASQPTANVTVTITPDSQSTVSSGSLTFTTANWSATQTITVTAVDDDLAEGPHSSVITHKASSTDPVYSGIAISNVTANVTDDDIAGVIIDESGGSTNVNEQNTTTDTYTVKLASQPRGNVTITLASDSGATVSPGSLTFTTANWNSTQPITVTAVDDDEAEGDHTCVITHAASSIDPEYSGIAVASVTAHVTDDDMPGVTIVEPGGATTATEGGDTDTYTVVLNSQPTADVVVTVTTDGRATVDRGTLTFTPVTWDVAQTVIVTAVNDSVAEGLHTSTITHSAASTDITYSGIHVRSVVAQVTDDEAAAVTIVESTGSTDVSEQGLTSDTYTVVLATPPTADVTITISTDGQATVDKGTLTFTPADWDVAQTVTVSGVEDYEAEGEHICRITHRASSVDGPYNGISIPDVMVYVTDNDTAGVTIGETGGSTAVNEAGTTSDNYSIKLNSAPTSTVTIRVVPQSDLNVGNGVGVARDLTFTPLDWNVAQTVTVTPVNDQIAQGRHTRTITHQISSTDPYYSVLTVPAVSVRVTDNDCPGVTVDEVDGSVEVDETSSTSDVYTVALNTQPTANVTITISSDAHTTVSPVTLTFTNLNWSVAQTVTVTAVDDGSPEGLHASVITHSASSADTNYSGISIPDVTAQVQDNDVPGVTVDQTGGSTAITEGGATDTYTVKLNTQPTADVTVTVSTDGQATVSPGTLTFTTANWNVAQTVTVTAINDSVAKGLHYTTITHMAASTDLNYNGVTIVPVSAAITDNDTAGVTIAESGGSVDISESGTTNTYTVVLKSRPSASVTITVTPDAESNVGSGAGVARTLTFTTVNWNATQTITVSAVNDSKAEGIHTSTIMHSASSADPCYSGIAIAPVVAHITDDDTLGVVITESGGSTNVTEGGATDSYTIALNSQPSADVTITITTGAEVTVSSASLTFTPINWSTAQTITVTAVDDSTPEGPHPSSITHTASSTDPYYSGIAIVGVTVHVTDDDIAGVLIEESGGSTDVNEAGTTSDTYTVELNAPPTANVTVTVTSDAQTTVSPATLTFTTVNWGTPQTVTVTAVNDSEAEGAHTSTLTHSIASTDTHYNGIAISGITVHVTDNDTAGVTIEESGGSIDVNEQGLTSDSYTVVLNTPPTATVTVTIAPDASTTVSPGTLTFTPANWNTTQTVTVTAVDDALAEGAHDSTITHAATSTDSHYSGAAVRNVVAHVTDNDAAGVTIEETGSSSDVDEQGPTFDTYTVVLNTQPTADVTITVAPDTQADVGAGTGVARTLTFTTGNWNTPQTVTITAVDDANPEGVHTSTITHAAASTDMTYSGVAVRSVTVHVTDNDAVGVTITESGGSTAVNETGPGSDSYSVVLNTLPTGNVTVTVTPDGETDVSAGPGTPITLTFTPANWNTAQTVTVTAVDDSEAEGAHSSTITHSAASTDANYNALSIRNVAVHLTDNDTAGVTIAEFGGSTAVNEQGATTDTYTVVLNTQPSANVTITVGTDGQATVDKGTLTFTPANWSTSQTVTITAVDDSTAEGAHASTITHSAVSTDTNYNSVAIAVVTVQITDNDTVGVTIAESGTSCDISESGSTTDTYTVVLNTRPSADVTISVMPDVQTTVSPNTLTFTSANWNTPQTVTVTAVDDAVAEGAHISTIMHHAASTDTHYSGVSIRDIFVHVTDDDIAGVTITQSGGTTQVSEDGPTSDSYTVVLNAPPASADVIITVTPDAQTDVGAGGGSPTTLTFTPANWSTPQTVTVTAVDDAAAEGPHSSIITHTTASIDPHYNAIVVSNVIVSVADDDSAAVVIGEPNGSTLVNEAGPTSDTYTVVLSIAPTSNVTITVDPDSQTNVGPGPGQPVNLTFTPANWNVPQTVTVTAVDDLTAEGAHTSAITHTAVSADLNYNGISIRNVTVSVIDNDTAGVMITQSGGATEIDETGPTSDTYTVQLTIPPTSDVTVTVHPDTQASVGAGPSNPITLMFTPGNWNVPQTVTVIAVDDETAEGARHYAVITHSSSSSDTNYNAITIASVTAIVTDNDTAGVNIGESGGSTEVAEAGPTSDSYTIVLDTPPIANVTVTVSPDEQTSVGAGPGMPCTILFTPGNWNMPQTVTVTAVQDGIAEGKHKSTIRHATTSADSTYNAIAIRPVVVTVVDKDTAGVTVTETGGSTAVNEQGATTDTYTVVLNTQPTANVTIAVSVDAQVTVSLTTLIFTPANWNAPQSITVTAVDDPVAEGNHRSAIVHCVASTDIVYNGVVVRSISVAVTDNDVAGVSVAESGSSTNVNEEGRTSDTYTLTLNTPPTANVTVTAYPDQQVDLGNGPGEPKLVTFTPADWNSPKTLTVRAVDDAYAEGPHFSTITHVLASSDTVYNGATIRSVTVSLTDNDIAGLTIAETDGLTQVDEQGPTTDAYTVILNTPPTGDVIILIDPDSQTNLGEGAGVPITRFFTPGNWNVPQTITVAATDDSLPEGVHASTITHIVTSTDRCYNGLVRNVIVSVEDNDVAGVSVTESGGSTRVNEAGPTQDSYTLVLNSPPTSELAITADPDGQIDLGAGPDNSVTLIFTKSNWNVPQTIHVTAVDDHYAEGEHASTIVHRTSSADRGFNGIAIRNITVHLTDNDVAGVTVSETEGGTEVAEDGTSDTYTVVLNTHPKSDVVISLCPDKQTNLGSGAGTAVNLTFTPDNWGTPQTVTVTAVDDPYAEGQHHSIISHVARSADPAYNEITIRTVDATIVDNDTKGVSVIESDGSTDVDEGGSIVDTYSIVLNTQITGAVRITASPEDLVDLGAGPGMPVTLTFTPADWNVPQTISVTGVDDTFIARGSRDSLIRHRMSTSDGSYIFTDIDSVVVHIEDNDPPSSGPCAGGGLLLIAGTVLLGLMISSADLQKVSIRW